VSILLILIGEGLIFAGYGVLGVGVEALNIVAVAVIVVAGSTVGAGCASTAGVAYGWGGAGTGGGGREHGWRGLCLNCRRGVTEQQWHKPQTLLLQQSQLSLLRTFLPT